MADRGAKAALFDGLVSAAKALSSGRRAEIVDVLAQGERADTPPNSLCALVLLAQ